MNSQRILNKIQSFIDFILAIFGNRFKGYRTLVASIAIGIASAMNYRTGFISSRLCENYQVLCDSKTASWFSVFMLILSICGYIARKLIDLPAGELTPERFFKRFTSKYRDEVQRLRHRF